MSSYAVRGGLVFMDPKSGRVRRVVAFQFNPDSLTRTIQVRGAGEEAGDRLEALRLAGPAKETYKLDAEFDAIDLAEAASEHGLAPILAALETTLSPKASTLRSEHDDASLGLIEIAAAEADLTLLVLGTKRVLPVRITEFSVTEEAFDADLNPVRAKVSISARVLTVDDVGFDHRGGAIYLTHLQRQEQLADLTAAKLGALGL